MSNTTTTAATTPVVGVKVENLVRGDVLTFTKDLSFLGPMWADRRPGVHFIYAGASSSGYCLEWLNTRTGKMEGCMADSLHLELLRVVGHVAQVAPERCDRCASCPDCGTE